jgi:UDP-N-acetylmuramoyl-tripeptide--D-alanyl-D-alanine ligase
MKRPLEWVARRLGLELGSQKEVTGWSIDSRTVQAGDLFFALRGPKYDGHAYIAEVFGKGAVAVVADRAVATGDAENASGPVLRVEDSLEALQRVASEARREWAGEVVAVTGSAGKTSSKEAIAAMLAVGMETARNEGNLNNHIGLPLSLLRVPESARAAVMEMGMNHAGEIRALARIAGPQVGVVTNVGWAHVENFDGIEGIAAAKRELIEELGPQGVAVLNADDPRVAAFAKVHPGRTVLYGQSSEVRVEDGTTRFRVGTVEFETQLAGRHNVSNILAGIAVAGVYGIGPEKLVDAVRQLHSGKMRGERFVTPDGMVVLNDCYNSNPDAARAMLDVLRDTPAKRRIAVLGEMRELGAWSDRLHQEVGQYAVNRGVDVLIAIGRPMLPSEEHYFDDPETAGRFVRQIAQAGDAILFKGSRGVRVEKALEQFLHPDEEGRS